MEFSLEDLIEIMCKASNIEERLGMRFKPNHIKVNNSVVDSRLEQWCQVVADGDWEKFEKRLQWDDLDLTKVRHALDSVHFNNAQNLPTWVETLNESLKAINCIAIKILDNKAFEKHFFLDPEEPLTFEEIFLSFVNVAHNKLISLAGTSYYLLSKASHASLERSLLRRLTYICAPTMQLEFSLFRLKSQPAILRLSSQSSSNQPRKQYREFVKSLLEGGILSFFRKYPVLARLTATVTDLWVEANEEFLRRLELEYSEIQKSFSREIELGQVVAIRSGLSDYHYNGRSVILLKFRSGLQLIYKPKNLGIEKHFFSLLDWLNNKGISLSLKKIRVMDCSNYGWVEFVEALPCKELEEVKRYYYRAGMLLCLAYILGGTDLHQGNLIACGEHPVLVDLETLINRQIDDAEALKDPQDIQYIANQKLRNSVLATGLLPRWHFGAEGKSYDATGFGGINEQEIPFRTPHWKNINTDSMTLGFDYVKIQPSANVPSLNGSNLSPNDYIEELVSGFREMYSFFISYRQDVVRDPNSPLYGLANQLVRYILRPTEIYISVLEKTFHPNYLRDGAERSIQLDVLSRRFLTSNTKPCLWSLLSIEKQNLEKLDIPLFVASSNHIEKCFTSPVDNYLIARINQLNDEDLAQQIDIIQGSFHSRVAAETHHLSSQALNSFLPSEKISPLTREAIVKQTIKMAEYLRSRAIFAKSNSATWIAPQYIIEAQRYQLQPMGYGLYDGCCGIAIFLAALEKVTGGAGFRDFAKSVLQPLRQELAEHGSEPIVERIGIGGIAGIGSIIYALVLISQLLDESILVEDAKQVASLISFKHIAADKKFDIMSGTAGTILGLLALYKAYNIPQILVQAVACGHHLLNNRVVSDLGFKTWATVNGKLLSGFSHGAAGIAYALLLLYQNTHETVFLEAAKEAIAYEHSVYIPEEGNWPDFRLPLSKKGFRCQTFWCHGAPGIGLARIGGLDILDTEQIREDIKNALNTTKQYQLGNIDNLCCGNLGRVDFLFTAAQKLDNSKLLEIAMELAAQIVARSQQNGTFTFGLGLKNSPYYPGFFQGAAGIGYELLRLVYPNILPSVLLLEYNRSEDFFKT